ncbi:MAG: hypothetical protein AAGI17_07190 [Planctomycetota bacterium]
MRPLLLLIPLAALLGSSLLGGCASHTPIDQIKVLSELHESGTVPIGRWGELDEPHGEVSIGPGENDIVYYDRRGIEDGTLLSFGKEGAGARIDQGLIALGNMTIGKREVAVFLASYTTPRQDYNPILHGSNRKSHVRALAARVNPETNRLIWRVGDLSEIAEHQAFRVSGDMPWSRPSLDWDDTLRCFDTGSFLGSITVKETQSGAKWSVPVP